MEEKEVREFVHSVANHVTIIELAIRQGMKTLPLETEAYSNFEKSKERIEELKKVIHDFRRLY